MSKFCTTILIILLSQFIYAQKLVSIDSIPTHIGDDVMICDKVIDAFKPAGENKLIYLNFGGKYPDEKFTAVIFPKDQPKFPFNPINVLNDKNVCITGKISEYKGKAQMVLNDPSQLVLKD